MTKRAAPMQLTEAKGDKLVRAAVIKGLRDWGVNFPDREMPELIDYIMKRLKSVSLGGILRTITPPPFDPPEE